jgi:predicted amino acid dehydrogenase
MRCGARPRRASCSRGLVRLPMPVRFGAQNVLGSPDDRNLACLCETMVLALDGARRSHSIGNRIAYDEAMSPPC